MEQKARNTLVSILSICFIVLVVLLACIRCIIFVERQAKNRPDEPFKELPSIRGHWESARGHILFTRALSPERDIEGKRAWLAFEKGGDGPAASGLVITFNGQNEAPTGERAEMILYTLEKDQITRREKGRYRVHNDTLQLWDEAGRETVYSRKK